MSLTRLIAGHIRGHWRPYAASALMLSTIAVLTVWIPRQVGHVVDALVAHRLAGWDLIAQLGLLVLAGLAIYLLRVGWRLALFRTAYELGRQLRTRLYAQLTRQGPAFFHAQRTGDLMALATNDVDAIEMAAGEALLAAFDGSLTLILVLGILGFAFWRSATNLHGHVRAGAEMVVEVLAAQSHSTPGAPDHAELDQVEQLLPGIGAPISVKLESASPAIGRTLAELNLRGETGATVLAIHRPGGSISVPTAHERLCVEDVLALTGTREAVEAAERLLNPTVSPPNAVTGS